MRCAVTSSIFLGKEVGEQGLKQILRTENIILTFSIPNFLTCAGR